MAEPLRRRSEHSRPRHNPRHNQRYTVVGVLPGDIQLALEDPSAASIRTALLVMFGAVGLVLLIACANMVNLLVVRNAAREREVALRSAIGASAWQLIRQLLTESTLLSLFGGAVGLPLAFDRFEPNLPVTHVMTMDSLISESVSPRRFSSVLVAIFAGLALLLAANGIYGVTSYTVGQRKQEIALRMALGAQRHAVRRLILGQTLKREGGQSHHGNRAVVHMRNGEERDGVPMRRFFPPPAIWLGRQAGSKSEMLREKNGATA